MGESNNDIPEAQYNCFNISGKQGQLKGNNAEAAAKGPGLICRAAAEERLSDVQGPLQPNHHSTAPSA
jgi:hypothetical protein